MNLQRAISRYWQKQQALLAEIKAITKGAEVGIG